MVHQNLETDKAEQLRTGNLVFGHCFAVASYVAIDHNKTSMTSILMYHKVDIVDLLKGIKKFCVFKKNLSLSRLCQMTQILLQIFLKGPWSEKQITFI